MSKSMDRYQVEILENGKWYPYLGGVEYETFKEAVAVQQLHFDYHTDSGRTPPESRIMHWTVTEPEVVKLPPELDKGNFFITRIMDAGQINQSQIDDLLGQRVTINGLTGMVITNAWAEDGWLVIECYIGDVEFTRDFYERNDLMERYKELRISDKYLDAEQ